MKDLKPEDIRWIVDPLGDYTVGRGPKIVAWLDAWDKPANPSSRYSMIKEHGDMIWAGYKCHIGVATEEDADEFIRRWGGFKAPGGIKDGQFYTTPADAWGQRGFVHEADTNVEDLAR